MRIPHSFTDAEQHRAAGILEGFLTAGEIYPTYLNNLAFVFGTESSIPPEVKAFMSEQEAWAKEQVCVYARACVCTRVGVYLALCYRVCGHAHHRIS